MLTIQVFKFKLQLIHNFNIKQIKITWFLTTFVTHLKLK